MVAYNYKIAHGFRSGLEERVCEQLAFLNILDCYEIKKIPFVQPEKNRNYTPDFWLPNGIIVETKGVFTVQDRQKHLLIKEQYPDLDLRFVFSNSKNKLRKGSKTTYADWCNKYGFIFADQLIPEQWINEKKRGNNENKKPNESATKRIVRTNKSKVRNTRRKTN
tara:strand:+ start:2034 stop:2528 length:495 start_codon:yes stop_codon:yes gene_type:complete